MIQCLSVTTAGTRANSRGSRGFRFLRRFLRAYSPQLRRIWNHLPGSLRTSSMGRLYGRHLHAVVRFHAERKQYFATFFLRNRAELDLMRQIADQKAHGSDLKIAVIACSKGAEVYSIAWAIRSARPDLKLCVHAVDISQEILEFAEKGIYSLTDSRGSMTSNYESVADRSDVTWNTCRDQNASIFERMTEKDIKAMFEVDSGQASIRAWLKGGITWFQGDAGDPQLARALGAHDIVVANRFLCHMEPAPAERCLRNISKLVKPGGFLFVSGIDLHIRTRVARNMGWKPVTDLIREIHDGDASLRQGWPLEYWGLEPFSDTRADWRVRYASVFQLGEAP
jgi:chemotaxis methyl-accepting protein methylase